MLEDRPILQRSLIGMGAFAFVFTAAMGGTAFMISGGLPFGADRASSAASGPSPDYVTITQAALSDFAAPPAAAAPPAPATAPADFAPAPEPAEHQDALYAAEPLDGESADTSAYAETNYADQADTDAAYDPTPSDASVKLPSDPYQNY